MRREHKYHRVCGEGLFQFNFHVFSIAKALGQEWWIYMRNLKEGDLWYIGKVSEQGIEIADQAFLGETGIYLRSNIHRLKQKIHKLWLSGIEPRSVMCYNNQMTKRRKPERDDEIVEKKDGLKWSYRRIANHYGMAVSSVYEAYERGLSRRSVRKVKVGKSTS